VQASASPSTPAERSSTPDAPAEQAERPSLYRRHRPRTFAEVVGQEAVVRTLRHAVERGQVHHAYLFVGSRGTGKTSMAKILAACLNCERAPTVEPCGTCEACVGIARASSLDVIEMDAASNNSVDDIRELRDSVAYAPVSGGQKVYILDEAHMLSTAAWNAFLKTLEEPPPRTVFVLATTEAAKVPATVVDRCHRFDFQRPTVEQLAAVVRRAAGAEAIDIPPEAVAAVARAATGSFRDALGTLEQLVTYSGPTIALEDVLAVLGVTDAAVLEELLEAVRAGDARAVLLALGACAQSGRDAGALAGDLEVRVRELLVVQVLGEVPGELALTPEADARLRAQAERLSETTLVRLLELLAGALEAVRAGADPRTQLELALVKAARPELDTSTLALTARIERLEGRPAVEQGEGPPQAASDSRVAGASAVAEGSAATASTPASGPESPTAAEPTPAEPLPSRAEPEAPASVDPEVPVQADVAPSRAQACTSVDPEVPVQADVAPSRAQARTSVDPGAPAPTDPALSPSPAASVATPQSETPSDSLDSLRELWPAVVEAVRAPNAMLAAAIVAARPVELSGEELLVAFDPDASFMMKKAAHPDNRELVAQALRELTGRRLRLAYELRADMAPVVGAPGGGHSEEEWVARFMDELDAEELPGEWAASGDAAPRDAAHGDATAGNAASSDTTDETAVHSEAIEPSEKAE
jgi:DNA polymerase III subunit gamma/tau